MGREFIDMFDEWADSYDLSVTGHDKEYREVFDRYDDILTTVASKSIGTVVEFGVGTGNLTEKLLSFGRTVYGIEPSKAMREKAKARFPQISFFDGDFLQFPALPEKVDSIVSTYAFHHLTDEEKDQALQLYSQLLNENGKIVFADTAFLHEQDRQERHEMVKRQGYYNLLNDLKTEYYTTIDILHDLFTKNGFDVSFKKLNVYVWLMEAVKK
ncbi:class I SAM-dependent methyltransferase [Fictibacillus sp. Mic-4]|uniref:class I SAM-dependent DNA methyltransferase n=1 Tax=Fictibacillus TaxID=1329200 RepID=UPI00042478D3|nr:class I SAM-dependent methyltransferase [Fictibacillus gelatini]